MLSCGSIVLLVRTLIKWSIETLQWSIETHPCFCQTITVSQRDRWVFKRYSWVLKEAGPDLRTCAMEVSLSKQMRLLRCCPKTNFAGVAGGGRMNYLSSGCSNLGGMDLLCWLHGRRAISTTRSHAGVRRSSTSVQSSSSTSIRNDPVSSAICRLNATSSTLLSNIFTFNRNYLLNVNERSASTLAPSIRFPPNRVMKRGQISYGCWSSLLATSPCIAAQSCAIATTSRLSSRSNNSSATPELRCSAVKVRGTCIMTASKVCAGPP